MKDRPRGFFVFVGAAIFLLLAAGWGGVLFAAEQSSPYKVYVPTNEQGEPDGDVYYISSNFLNELLKATAEPGVSHPSWSITGARYVCSFSSNMLPQRQSPLTVNFKAIFEIQLDTENATLVLPDLPLQTDGAKWDDVPIQPIRPVVHAPIPKTSQADSAEPLPFPKKETIGTLPMFRLEQQKPGKHVLELLLNPVVEQIDATGRRIVLPVIPKVADAVLEVNLPPEMSSISVEEALGPIADAPGKLTVQLGPAEKLTLSWIDNTIRPAQTVVESDQLYLISAQTNQIGVRVLHKFRISGGSIQQLDLAVDPSLSLAGNPICENAPDTVLPSFETSVPAEGLTRLLFKEPISGHLTLRVNYFLRNFSGIGDVRFPEIPRPSHRLGKCWLAVRSSPTLEVESLPLSTISLDRFQQDWGTPIEERLLAAYDFEAAPPTGTMSIRVKPPTVHAKVGQSVVLRQNRSDWFVEAAFETDVPHFNCSFFLPESLRIDHVEVRANETVGGEPYQLPIDWRVNDDDPSRPPSGTGTGVSAESTGSSLPQYRILSILSERPLRDKYEISLRGHSPVPPEELNREVALIRADRVDQEEYQVDLFRDPLLVIQDFSIPDNWTKGKVLPPSKPEFSKGIPIGSWTVKTLKTDVPPASAARFALSPNTPFVSGRQITQLVWNLNTNRFEPTITFDLTVEKGELNSFRLRYDEQCVFPPTVVPPMKMDEILEEGNRYILLTPNQPLTGKVLFTLKASLGASTETTFLPRIFPNEPFPIKHYVVLPTDHLLRPIRWDKNQLSAVEAKDAEGILQFLRSVTRDSSTASGEAISSESPPKEENFNSAGSAPTQPSTAENFEVLAVSGPEYSARINSSDNRSTVQLNDVHLYLRKNGYVSGVSSFDLRGEGADHCVLVLPQPYELVSITSGGVMTRGTPLSTGRWKFDIWANQLPQKIEVVFRGRLPSASDSNDHLLAEESVSANGEQNGPADPTLNQGMLPLYTAEGIQSLSLELPYLESTNVVGTIWTLVMESPARSHPTRFYVDQFQGESGALGRTYAEADLENKETVLPLVARDAVPCLILMDMIRLSNMEEMMTGTSVTGASSPGDVANWFSLWGRSWWGFRRELDSLLLSRQLDSPSSWKRSVFQSSGKVPDSMKRILDSGKRPEQLARELAESYDKSILPSLQAAGREIEGDINESAAYAAFRMSYSENIAYLFGVAGEGVRTLNVISVTEKPTIFENKTVRWSLGLLAIAGGIILVRWIHPRRLYRQYPFFVGCFVAVVLWLLLPPGFIGLILIPLLWLALIWPSWKRSQRTLD